MSRPPEPYELAAPPDPECRSAPPAGRVLCFAPHADDEVIGPGGALALHRRQGDPVRVVIATAGSAGDPAGRFAGQDLAALRQAESRAGLARLGVDDLDFWGYPDSCVVTAADLDGISARAAAELRAFGPQVVYLPWAGERNSDHRALHAGVARALDRVGFAGEALGYEVWTPMDPDLLLDVSSVADAKRAAIRCYATQLLYVDYEHVIFGLNAYRSLLHQRGQGFAEAFQRLGGRP